MSTAVTSRTAGARYKSAKLQPAQVLSRALAFCWYLSRLMSRDVGWEEARMRAEGLADRYFRMTNKVEEEPPAVFLWDIWDKLDITDNDHF